LTVFHIVLLTSVAVHRGGFFLALEVVRFFGRLASTEPLPLQMPTPEFSFIFFWLKVPVFFPVNSLAQSRLEAKKRSDPLPSAPPLNFFLILFVSDDLSFFRPSVRSFFFHISLLDSTIILGTLESFSFWLSEIFATALSPTFPFPPVTVPVPSILHALLYGPVFNPVPA